MKFIIEKTTTRSVRNIVYILNFFIITAIIVFFALITIVLVLGFINNTYHIISIDGFFYIDPFINIFIYFIIGLSFSMTLENKKK